MGIRGGFADPGVWCIEGLSFFQDLPRAASQELRQLHQSVAYQRGESIYLPGDPTEVFYALKAGKVKLVYLDRSGRRLTLLILKQGQLFGESALSEGKEHRLVAEALTDVTLCTFSKAEFLGFLQEHPQISLKVAKLIGQRRREIEQKLEDLLFKRLPSRLATLLLKLSSQFGEAQNGWKRIPLRLTHQEVADLIGATRESTSLELKRFEKMGLIKQEQKQMIILDEETLKKVSLT